MEAARARCRVAVDLATLALPVHTAVVERNVSVVINEDIVMDVVVAPPPSSTPVEQLRIVLP